MNLQYCSDYIKYTRRNTIEVKVGNVSISGKNDICLQTMTNTPTSDVGKTVSQVISSYKAGAQLVRITIPSKNDLISLQQIKQKLTDLGYEIPLVADIHFNQQLAFEAAKIVDKVRINPGNFTDTKKFQKLEYSDTEYQEELERLSEAFIPLLRICKEYSTVLRIGSNHGSLSDRIMSKYGDTPEGMAESAMEFLRICKKQYFNDVVISMKASNTLIMVQATRLLVAKMNNENMYYPLHLGVTEAGEGEDGRIKSAVGIGALLADGIGDTIRISLTEPPENEIVVGRKLVKYMKERIDHTPIAPITNYPVDPYSFNKRETYSNNKVGGNNVPVVISSYQLSDISEDLLPDFVIKTDQDLTVKNFLPIYTDEINTDTKQKLMRLNPNAIVLKTLNKNGFADQRSAIINLMNDNIKIPVILYRKYAENDLESFQVKASADLGGLFLDGLAEGIWLDNDGNISPKDINSTAFGILQASRMRVSKPEYISCPSCGRTMFNLQDTTQKIREKTAHLKGLKIGIMGCIVNGLGEMADADYGYIGSGAGKVNLYYNKNLVKRGIQEDHAVDELLSLIKEKGDWIEP